MKALYWNVAVVGAHVLSKREMSVISRKDTDRIAIALRDLDLRGKGIRFHIDSPIASHLVFVDFLAASHVHENIGVAIQLSDLLLRHAVTPSAWVCCSKS